MGEREGENIENREAEKVKETHSNREQAKGRRKVSLSFPETLISSKPIFYLLADK